MARILVIDDQLHLRELIKSFLQLDGHDVSTAQDGKAGLFLNNTNRFDLIITDIIMPEQDGFEVMQTVAGQANPPKVIAITGGSRNLDPDYLMKTAKLMGSVKVLKKPVSYEELHTAVNEALAS